MSNQTLTKLNSEWALWFHKCDDNDWDFSSYTSLGTFDCIEDYSIIMNAFEPGHVENSMLFLMRDEIKPMWEAEENKDGGCISFKVYKNQIYECWIQLANNLIGENLLKNGEQYLKVNGISISPKKTFSILKIWFSDEETNDAKTYLNTLDKFKFEDAIYKSHLGK
jgi:hypothetical protein